MERVLSSTGWVPSRGLGAVFFWLLIPATSPAPSEQSLAKGRLSTQAAVGFGRNRDARAQLEGAAEERYHIPGLTSLSAEITIALI
jgi:hypothetical protein